MKKKSAPSNVLIRSDRNLLALGLIAITLLFTSLFLLPNPIVNVPSQPAVAFEELAPTEVDNTFAAEQEYSEDGMYESVPLDSNLDIPPQELQMAY